MVENLLRPMRLKHRHPSIYGTLKDICELVIKHGWTDITHDGVQGVTDLLANWLLGQNAKAEIDRVLDLGLEHPVGALNLELVAAAHFRIAGSHAFLLSDDVIAMLANSSLADVRIGDIKLPYDALYLAFETPLPINGATLLEGAYLAVGGDGFVFRLCFSTTRQGWPEWLIDPGMNIILSGAENTLADAIDGHLLFSARLAAEYADDPMATQSNALRSAVVNHGSRINVSKRPTSVRYTEFIAENRIGIEKALAVVASAACLLTEIPDDLMGPMVWCPSKRSTGSKVMKTMPGSIEARYLTLKSSRPNSEITNTVGSKNGPRAHWRRGHFRRQPYGPKGDATFRPKWIRPVLVNPENGSPAERSEYRVEV